MANKKLINRLQDRVAEFRCYRIEMALGVRPRLNVDIELEAQAATALEAADKRWSDTKAMIQKTLDANKNAEIGWIHVLEDFLEEMDELEKEQP